MRNDVHCPKQFVPTDYEYVGPIYQGASNFATSLLASLPWVQATRKQLQDCPFAGNHARKGTCDHCGAHFSYGEVFKHLPTGEHIAVGHICGSTIFGYSSHREFEYARLRKVIRGYRTTQKAADKAADFIETNGLAGVFDHDHPILQDMNRRLMKHGSLTERQVAYAKKLANDEANKATRPHVVVGTRVTLTGTVVSVRRAETDSYFNNQSRYKVVMLDDRGFKVWGTLPTCLEDQGVGARVTFTADVTQSQRDPSFGFFKRPTKAAAVNKQLVS